MTFERDKTYYIKGEEDNKICIYGLTCDEYIRSNGIAYCMAGKECLDNGTTVDMVMIDSMIYKFPEVVQNFMIYHEVGHIKHGHFKIFTIIKPKQILICRLLGIPPKMEVEADCYAASMVGIENARLALKYLMYDKMLPLGSRIEIFKRLLRVKEVPMN